MIFETVEAGAGQFKQVRHSLASLARAGDLNLIDGDLEQAQRVAQTAIDGVAAVRAGAGLRAKAIESEMSLLRTELENVAAARSVIVDTDVAREISQLVRARILKQATLFAQRTALAHSAANILASPACVTPAPTGAYGQLKNAVRKSK